MKTKQLTVLAASLFITILSQAQIKQGSVFLGGDVFASTQKTKSSGNITDKQTGINFSPTFGKAIKDNLIIGGNIAFGFSESRNPTGYDMDADNYGLGLFVRKYKNLGTGGFYFFLQGGINGNYQKSKLTSNNSTYVENIKRVTVGLNAYPGVSYAINKKIHLETGFNNLLSLNFFTEDRKLGEPVSVTNKTNGFNISSSLSNANSALYIGFRVLLGK